MSDRTWIIFHCPNDNSIVVSKLEGNLALGVADCPDMRTATAVMEAMKERDKRKAADLGLPLSRPGDEADRLQELRRRGKF